MRSVGDLAIKRWTLQRPTVRPTRGIVAADFYH